MKVDGKDVVFQDPGKECSPEWIGFLVSTTKVRSRKMSYCKACKNTFSDRLERLSRHKLQECKKFPDSQKVISRKRALDPEAFTGITESSDQSQSIRKFLISEKKMQTAAVLWAKGLICKSVPLRALDERHLCQLFELLGVPKLSSRKFVSNDVIPQVIYMIYAYFSMQSINIFNIYLQIYHEINKKQEARLLAAHWISVILDGWTDVSNKNIMSVILKCKDEREEEHVSKYEYIGNANVGGRHTGENLAEATKEAIPETALKNIIAIVSDSAANMKKMKAEFIGEVPTAFFIPCILHVLNLVTQDILKEPTIKKKASGVITVASFFNRSYYYSDKLSTWANNTKGSGRIQTFSPTRWCGFVDCLQSILIYESGLLALANGSENKKLPKKIKEILLDDYFFLDCRYMKELLEPIAVSIRKLESDDSSVSDVLPTIFNLITFYKNKSDSVASEKRNVILLILNIISDRTSFYYEFTDNLPNPFLLSLYLNPKFKSLATSRKYCAFSFKNQLVFLLKKWNYGKAFAEKCLEQFDLYSLNYIQTPNAGSYWESNNWFELSTVVNKLNYIVPHSAVCERLFSTMAYMKKKWQNKMSPQTLTAYVKIKLALQEQKPAKDINNNDDNIVISEADNFDEYIVDESVFDFFMENQDDDEYFHRKGKCIDNYFDVFTPNDIYEKSAPKISDTEEWSTQDYVN